MAVLLKYNCPAGEDTESLTERGTPLPFPAAYLETVLHISLANPGSVISLTRLPFSGRLTAANAIENLFGSSLVDYFRGRLSSIDC